MKTIPKYVVGWFGLVVLAIVNGTIRAKGYGSLMSELSAHQLSTVMGLGLFGVYVWILTGVWRIESSRQALAIGGIWLILTIVFEFFFGHYVVGHPWTRLFHDYNLLRGRLWLLVLLWTAVAPYVFYRLRA